MLMASRRMFSLTVINSARFLRMPIDSQTLYFHLGMRADDDGIVEAFPVLRLVGSAEDNLHVLAAKGFVRVLNEDLVTHITDWHEHNLIRADRKVDSIYKGLLVQVLPGVTLIEPRPRADTGKSTGRPTDNQRPAQGRVGKDSIGKVNKKRPAKPPEPPKEEIKPFNASETRQVWYDGDKEDFQLLAWFFDQKGLWKKFDSREKVEHAVTRHIRATRRIIRAGWSQEECATALKALKKNEKMQVEWTLETLEKYLTK